MILLSRCVEYTCHLTLKRLRRKWLLRHKKAMCYAWSGSHHFFRFVGGSEGAGIRKLWWQRSQGRISASSYWNSLASSPERHQHQFRFLCFSFWFHAYASGSLINPKRGMLWRYHRWIIRHICSYRKSFIGNKEENCSPFYSVSPQDPSSAFGMVLSRVNLHNPSILSAYISDSRCASRLFSKWPPGMFLSRNPKLLCL